jgi:hypothetical protein
MRPRGFTPHIGALVQDAAELRHRISELGITQTEAARHLGLTVDGLAKQLSGARPVSRQTALLLAHLQRDRIGIPMQQYELQPPVDWVLWDTLMREQMAAMSGHPDNGGPYDAEPMRFHQANRHWLAEYRKHDWRRAILLERYLVKRINALANRGRSPKQKGRGQLPVPGG